MEHERWRYSNFQGRPGGVVVYQYTRKKFAKIPKNTQNSSKYTQNYTQVYFIPEIQRKWYTEYPYLSCNIPYTRFKKPLYTVYARTLADSEFSCSNSTGFPAFFRLFRKCTQLISNMITNLKFGSIQHLWRNANDGVTLQCIYIRLSLSRGFADYDKVNFTAHLLFS